MRWGARLNMGRHGLAALMLAAYAAAPAGAQDAVLERCEVEAYGGPARCGMVTVWEDPVKASGRTLALNVVVLEPTGPDSLHLPDPVFVLDGGPGQAATQSVEWVVAELAAVLRTRAVVLVDRRGTGGSNPLTCPTPARTTPEELLAAAPEGWLRGCRAALEARADLRKYTSPYAADDVDAVRDSLGYERVNLYGGSYGSREAFEYMRRHPSRLRSAVVFAVTPQHERALLQSPASAETAIQRLLDDCMAAVACRSAYPDLRRELREIVGRLEREPATFTVAHPDGTRSGPLQLTRTGWAGLIRSLLLSPGGGAQVPYLIHSTYRGNYDEVGGLYVRLAAATPVILPRGLFLSVVCAEEMARVREGEIGPATEGTFWGDGWVRSVRDQCAEWVVGDLPAEWADPPSGDSPFLFLAGWLDPIASPAWAEELRRHMPNARRVVVREGHHNFALDGCGQEVLSRFYDTADAANLDATCIARFRRPDFLIRAG